MAEEEEFTLEGLDRVRSKSYHTAANVPGSAAIDHDPADRAASAPYIQPLALTDFLGKQWPSSKPQARIGVGALQWWFHYRFRRALAGHDPSPQVATTANKSAKAARAHAKKQLKENARKLPTVVDPATASGAAAAKAAKAAAQRRARVTQVYDEFRTLAVYTATLIIDELHLPEKDRTVSSISAGGVAGGVKFVDQKNGIFFKLASDPVVGTDPQTHAPMFVYGDTAPNFVSASKVAANELKAANYCYRVLWQLGGKVQLQQQQQRKNRKATPSTMLQDITVPVQMIVEYRGFRVVCMVLCPLSPPLSGNVSQIVYGSEDGGDEVHTSVLEFNETMKLVARELYLAGHQIQDRTVHVAGDVEGHVDRFGDGYLLDLARLWPPESYKHTTHLEEDRKSILYRLLRPEFLLHLKEDRPTFLGKPAVPLSSDALSRWSQFDPEHNAAVHHATRYLCEWRTQQLCTFLRARARADRFDVNAACTSVHIHFIRLPEYVSKNKALLKVVEELRSRWTPLRERISCGDSFWMDAVCCLVPPVLVDLHYAQRPAWIRRDTYNRWLSVADFSSTFHRFGVSMRHAGLVRTVLTRAMAADSKREERSRKKGGKSGGDVIGGRASMGDRQASAVRSAATSAAGGAFGSGSNNLAAYGGLGGGASKSLLALGGLASVDAGELRRDPEVDAELSILLLVEMAKRAAKDLLRHQLRMHCFTRVGHSHPWMQMSQNAMLAKESRDAADLDRDDMDSGGGTGGYEVIGRDRHVSTLAREEVDIRQGIVSFLNALCDPGLSKGMELKRGAKIKKGTAVHAAQEAGMGVEEWRVRVVEHVELWHAIALRMHEHFGKDSMTSKEMKRLPNLMRPHFRRIREYLLSRIEFKIREGAAAIVFEEDGNGSESRIGTLFRPSKGGRKSHPSAAEEKAVETARGTQFAIPTKAPAPARGVLKPGDITEARDGTGIRTKPMTFLDYLRAIVHVDTALANVDGSVCLVGLRKAVAITRDVLERDPCDADTLNLHDMCTFVIECSGGEEGVVDQFIDRLILFKSCKRPWSKLDNLLPLESGGVDRRRWLHANLAAQEVASRQRRKGRGGGDEDFDGVDMSELGGASVSRDGMTERRDPLLRLCWRVSKSSALFQCLRRVKVPSDLVHDLLKYGADVNWVHPKVGVASLHVASGDGDVTSVKSLLEQKASVNHSGRRGETALHAAAEHGHVQVVKLLVGAGANRSAMTKLGATPLYVASQNGHSEVVAELLEHGGGSVLDMATKLCATPLYVAALQSHLSVVRVLLERGADFSHCDAMGKSVIEVAGSPEVYALLLQHRHAAGLDDIDASPESPTGVNDRVEDDSPTPTSSLNKLDGGRGKMATVKSVLKRAKSKFAKRKPSPGARWVQDKEAAKCMRCQVQFSVTRRRHHCRLCGFVVCRACSRNSERLMKNGHDANMRVCDICRDGIKRGNVEAVAVVKERKSKS